MILLFEYILAWRIPWTEEPGGPQSRRSQRVRHGERLTRFTFTLLFEMTPRQSAEVLSGVPKCGKTVMCLTGKKVCDKLGPGMSDRAHVGLQVQC